MKTLFCRVVLVCLAILSISSAAFSQTNSSWNGGTGTWNTAGSWTPSGVPNNGGGHTYNVTIDSGGSDVVTLNISPTMNLLNLGGASGGSAELTDASPETLTITGALAINATGDLDLENGSTVSAASATNAGILRLQGGSSLSVSGNLTNSNFLGTDYFCCSTGSSLTVTGTLTNNTGANFYVGTNNVPANDTDSVGTLVNNGSVYVGTGSTLKLTNQANGITDIAAGSLISNSGTISAGSNNGFYKLASIEGELQLENGKSTADTATTVTIASGGFLDMQSGSSFSVANITNSGTVATDYFCCGTGSSLTVSGTFTNNAGATFNVGTNNVPANDTDSVGTLVNNGTVNVGTGSTLNLTNQVNGITDVAASTVISNSGTINAGANNGFYRLASIEGELQLENGKSTADTAATLTIASGGFLDIQGASTVGSSFSVASITNSGTVATDYYCCGSNSSLTVSGTFTNNSGATFDVGTNNVPANDTDSVGTLVNNGTVNVGTGSTLNLTNQVNGITDVAASTVISNSGTINAGANNAFYKLATIEGELQLENGKSTADTVTTLTIASGGFLDIQSGSSFSVASITNSGTVATDYYCCGTGSSLTVSGTFTNNAGAAFYVGTNNVPANDTDSVGTLVNNGYLQVGPGSTLNLTNQPNGITDVVAGSTILLFGSFKAGSNSALANLASVEGTLELENGQSLADNATTLTVSGSGSFLDLQNGSSLTVANITNSSNVGTDYYCCSTGSSLIVTGTFTNNANANFYVGTNNVPANDTDSVGVLVNNSNGAVDIGWGSTLNLTKVGGTSTNNGTINIGSSLGAGALKISGNTTLTGTNGKVVLSNFAGNIIEGAASTDVLTVAKGQTVEGSGNIGNNSMGLNNQGVIEANQSTPLIIQISGTNSNSGTLEAIGGATLQLDAGTYTQTSTGNILATETGNALSAVNLESGVSITGGKLTTTGTTATINLVGTTPLLTLNAVSISGNGKLNLADGSTTTLVGTISNLSTIDVNGTSATTLKIGSMNTSLTGTGKIIFSDSANNIITGGSGDVLNTANTIEGAVNIGNGTIAVTNTGTIETLVHQVNQLEINASSAGFTNQGTLLAATGTTLYVDNATNQFTNFNSTTMTLTGGTYVVDGTLEFDNANIVTNNANITLSGAASKIISPTNTNALSGFATNGGTFAIASGRNFTTMGNFTNNGTLNVGGGTKFLVGPGGADNLTNFSGTTLVNGTYIVAGTLQFSGANIVTNDASITLSGAAAKIEDQTGANVGLANFATNSSTGVFQVTSGNVFTTAGSFTNNGTLTVGSTTSKFIVNSADSLTNFSGTTLTGGTYDVTGLLQFAGANIVTNAANITLTGTTSAIENSTGGNGLANFATNNSGATFDVTGGKVFTTGGSFTNNGTLTVGSSTSKFIVNSADSLTNFNSGTNTLTGGTYNLTGVLQFAGANIVNNAANITLTGTSSAIDNSGGTSGLVNFANNTSSGSFTLAGNKTFTTVGAFTNAGAMIINKGSTFTVLAGTGNNYSQSGGSTTVDGTLTVGATDAVNITGGNLFGATGNINGNVDLTGGVVNPGDGANLIGELKITGTYTQGSAGAATIDLGGKTAITQYSVLDITKTASLSGTLNVNLVNGFTPTVGNTFTILDYLSETGSFTTLNLPTVSGDHWTVTYNAKDVVLTLVAGLGPTVTVDNLTSDPASSTATPGTVSASPARRVSRGGGVLASTPSTHEPVAILSHVTCFAARLLGSASCGDHSVATTGSALGAVHNNVMPASAGAGGVHNNVMPASSRSALGSVHNNVMPATARPSLGAAHNNVMVATRSMSSARSGASNESSASASAMARLYVCAYMPSSVARTMGCSN